MQNCMFGLPHHTDYNDSFRLGTMLTGTRAAAKPLQSIYQLKATLKGIRPPIWAGY